MLDISTDYTIFDNKETITLTNTDDVELTINNVVRRRSVMDVVDTGGNVVYSADMRFIVFKDEFDIAEEAVVAGDGAIMHGTGTGDFIRISRYDGKPKVNAIITDAYGKSYAVDRVVDDALRTRWVLDCTSLAGENSG